MKIYYMTLFFIAFSLLCACSKPDSVQPANADLSGDWMGADELKQVGNCSWSGETSIGTTATWQVSDNTVTATFTRKSTPTSIIVKLTGTLSGNKISLNETKRAICNGVYNTHNVNYSGEVIGRTMTLVGLDTICPIEKCIFQQTLKLTHQ